MACRHNSQKVTVLGAEWTHESRPGVAPASLASFARPLGECACGRSVRYDLEAGRWKLLNGPMPAPEGADVEAVAALPAVETALGAAHAELSCEIRAVRLGGGLVMCEVVGLNGESFAGAGTPDDLALGIAEYLVERLEG